MRPTTPKTRGEFVIGTTDIVTRAVSPLPQRPTVHELDNSHIERELKSIAEHYGVASPVVYVWDMDVANGFVLGTPDQTIIVVSSALMNELTDDEVVAVLAHELAHTAQHHTLKLSGLLAGAIIAGAAVALAVKNRWCSKAALGTLLLIYGMEAVGLLSLTRRAEAQADSMAAEVVDTATLDSALHKIITAGRDTYPERNAVDKLIATHPSYEERAERAADNS